jgi:hypothetical protein
MWGNAGVAVASDDDVVEEAEADNSGGFDEGGGGSAIGEAGRGVAGRVVVRDGERPAVVAKHCVEHLAYRDR